MQKWHKQTDSEVQLIRVRAHARIGTARLPCRERHAYKTEGQEPTRKGTAKWGARVAVASEHGLERKVRNRGGLNIMRGGREKSPTAEAHNVVSERLLVTLCPRQLPADLVRQLVVSDVLVHGAADHVRGVLAGAQAFPDFR